MTVHPLPSVPCARDPTSILVCPPPSPSRILVDFFSPASRDIPSSVCPFRLLTHFHADHYKVGARACGLGWGCMHKDWGGATCIGTGVAAGAGTRGPS